MPQGQDAANVQGYMICGLQQEQHMILYADTLQLPCDCYVALPHYIAYVNSILAANHKLLIALDVAYASTSGMQSCMKGTQGQSLFCYTAMCWLLVLLPHYGITSCRQPKTWDEAL